MTRTIAWLIALAALGCGSGPKEGEHAEGEHAESERAEGAVVVSAAAIERTPIRLAVVRRERLRAGIQVPAEIELNPDRVAHVTAVVSGQVAEVKATLGDRVKKGQVLATLRGVALGEARSELARAQAVHRVAEANAERQTTLEREGIGSQRALIEARGELARAQADLASARERLRVYGAGGTSGSVVAIRSPLDGIIINRHATSGEMAVPEKPLFVVGDPTRVWAVGRVYEQDLAAIQMGAGATVTLEAYPGRSWQGKVDYVAAVLDEATRTLGIRVELDNGEGILRAGLFGLIRLDIDGAGGNELPVVPEAAIQKVEDKDVVFVPGDEPGEFRATPVVVGARADGKAALTSGLTAGQQFVAEGAFVLKSELMKAEMGEGHAH